MAKVKAGEGECPICAERIVWRLADSGSLSCFCQDCDYQGYAKEGTQAKKMLLGKMGAPDPVEKKENKTLIPKEIKKGAFGAFGL